MQTLALTAAFQTGISDANDQRFGLPQSRLKFQGKAHTFYESGYSVEAKKIDKARAKYEASPEYALAQQKDAERARGFTLEIQGGFSRQERADILDWAETASASRKAGNS